MTALFVLATVGCGFGSYFDRQLACEHDPFEWYEDLTSHVMRADGDGSFDYDLGWAPVTRAWGTYDYETGDFVYDYTYAEGYMLTDAHVEGYGVVYPSGDVDTLADVLTRDVLGAVVGRRERNQRIGCVGASERTAWVPQVDLVDEPYVTRVEVEIKSDNKVTEHVLEDVESYRAELWRDATASYTNPWRYTYEDADTSYLETGTENPDGSYVYDWSHVNTGGSATLEYVGVTQVAAGGGRSLDYSISEDGTVAGSCSFAYEYDGKGEGRCDFEGVVCDYVIGKDDACEVTCDDGYTGDC